MIYNNQDYQASGLCHLSDILKEQTNSMILVHKQTILAKKVHEVKRTHFRNWGSFYPLRDAIKQASPIPSTEDEKKF
jgi:signal-transduction protein with cAMP-binding, CBS, and nucleotidyltransferase domain